MSSVSLKTANAFMTTMQQKNQNANNLFTALEAGDLAKAKAAYPRSGLPAMGTQNTSALGRLFNALQKDDLKTARKAALELLGKPASSDTASTSIKSTVVQDPKAKLKAAALELVHKSQTQSNVPTLFGLGNNVNTWG